MSDIADCELSLDPSSRTRSFSTWIALGLPLLAALGVMLFLLFAHEERVLSLANDDAYYYFQIARHVVQGHGASFDGRDATNGFHPLYLVVLLPIFKLAPGDVLPIRLALVTLALCYFATSWTIYGIVRRLSGPRAALIAALAWGFNPMFLFFSRGGLEVAVYTFVASLLAWFYVTRFREEPTARHAVVLGGLAGLTMLARTDSLLFLAGIGVDFLVTRARRGTGLRPRSVVVLGGMVAATAAVVVSPWVLWNLSRFGTVVQTSSRAHRFAPFSKTLADGFATLLPAGAAMGVIAVALVGLGFALRAVWKDRALIRARTPGVLFLIVYLGLFAAALSWYQWFRNWYFLAPSMALVTAMAVALLPAHRAERRAAAWVFAAAWLAIAAPAAPRFASFTRLGEGSKAAIASDAEWIATHLPEDAVVGCFNAGRAGYFLPRPVVNLDGVVNNQAVAAFGKRDFDRYLTERGVQYVYDNPSYVYAYFDRYAASGRRRLEHVRRLSLGDLYRVAPSPA